MALHEFLQEPEHQPMTIDALLIVGLQQSKEANRKGGVEYLNVQIADYFEKHGVAVRDSKFWPDFSADSSLRVWVFVPTQGFLSPRHRDLYLLWLNAGWSVIEHNIFGLPSRYRPSHPNYVMATTSTDSAYRYAWRQFVRTGCLESRVAVLENVARNVESSSFPRPDGPKQIRFLRVGRPDRRKWSSFEVDFVRKLASEKPEMAFQLSLVGTPTEVVGERNSSLRITPHAYVNNILEVYQRHDIYLHFSSIGETYGNVFVEALSQGLPVIAGIDLRRDSGSLDFLNEQNAVIGTAEGLLESPVKAFESAFSKIQAVSIQSRTISDFCNDLVTVFQRTKAVRPFELRQHLNRQLSRFQFGEPSGPLVVMGFEFLRVVWNWYQRDSL